MYPGELLADDESEDGADEEAWPSSPAKLGWREDLPWAYRLGDLWRSEKGVSGVGDLLVPTTVVSVISFTGICVDNLSRNEGQSPPDKREELTKAVVTASMVTSRRNSLNLKRLGVPPQPRRRHRAPPLCIGPAPARAARPAAAHVLELAVLEGAHGRRGAGGGEADVGAGGVVDRVEVEVRVRAVVPGDGGVGAGMSVGVAAAHFGGFGWAGGDIL